MDMNSLGGAFGGWSWGAWGVWGGKGRGEAFWRGLGDWGGWSGGEDFRRGASAAVDVHSLGVTTPAPKNNKPLNQGGASPP